MRATITLSAQGGIRKIEVYGTRQAVEDEARRWARVRGVWQVWVRIDGKDYEVFQGQLIA